MPDLSLIPGVGGAEGRCRRVTTINFTASFWPKLPSTSTIPADSKPALSRSALYAPWSMKIVPCGASPCSNQKDRSRIREDDGAKRVWSGGGGGGDGGGEEEGVGCVEEPGVEDCAEKVCLRYCAYLTISKTFPGLDDRVITTVTPAEVASCAAVILVDMPPVPRAEPADDTSAANVEISYTTSIGAAVGSRRGFVV